MDEILLYNLQNELTIFGLKFLFVDIVQVQGSLSTIRQHILLYLSQKKDIQLLLVFLDIQAASKIFFCAKSWGYFNEV